MKLAPVVHHIVIPDTQAKPGTPTDHLRWIGQYIVDEFKDKNVKIIHLGDHADMPSLSSYDRGKKSMEGRRYLADIAFANEAWDVLGSPLKTLNDHRRRAKHGPWKPQKFILLGNHEDRINRVIENDAQMEDVVSTNHLDYSRTGWKVIPFKEILKLDGVAYSHFFYNPMTGKPFGGNAETRLKTIGHSFTMGHQQTLMYSVRFVSDQSQHALVAGSCYLHDEDYKGPQGNHHWRGIIVCHDVRDGSYDPMFISLGYLCRRYEKMELETFIAKKYPNLR